MVTKNNLLKTFSLTALAGLGLTAQAQTSQPNVIVILVDDLGYGDLSCQGVAKDIRTPNIDMLLNDGIRCTNLHSNCPVSSPSRASLLTGRYPDLVGVPGVIRTHEDDSWGYLSPDAVLLPKMLKEKNYHSAIIGKWHLGLEAPNTPCVRGFDYFKGFLGDMMDDYYTHQRWGNNYMYENDAEIRPQGQHATEMFTDWAIDYIESRKEKESPFFLYLAYNAPHTPIQPPDPWLHIVKKREKNITETRARLVALIEHLDDNIGRVYQALDSAGMLDNTLIVFASDNGGQADAGANNNPHSGAKQYMLEGGICVPGGFYWKDRIKPAVNHNFIMLSDIFPTLCDLTGIKINHEIDGISVLPTLNGKNQTTDERVVYWVRREGNVYGGRAYYASRFKNYKILQNTPWEPMQLFDLDTDPKEQKPLSIEKSERYQFMFEHLREHVRKAGAVPWQHKTN